MTNVCLNKRMYGRLPFTEELEALNGITILRD